MLRRTPKTESALNFEYPSGVFVHTEKGYFLIVGPDRRFWAIHKRVVDSWNPKIVTNTTEAALSKCKVTAKLKFRNGSLLYSQADGKIYLISDNKRRHIINPDVLTNLGIRRKDAVWVSLDEINLHQEGEPLS